MFFLLTAAGDQDQTAGEEKTGSFREGGRTLGKRTTGYTETLSRMGSLTADSADDADSEWDDEKGAG
jgi:hypothetical protein